MKLRRVDLLALAGAIGLVLFIAQLPAPRDTNPPIPDSPAHRGIEPDARCLSCHGPGQPHALPARHPKRTDCARCHRAAERVKLESSKVGKLEGWQVGKSEGKKVRKLEGLKVNAILS